MLTILMLSMSDGNQRLMELSQDWRFFFEGFELAVSDKTTAEKAIDKDRLERQARVQALIYRYRDLGHLLACLDPLAACPIDHPLLNPGGIQSHTRRS
jgi:2-oxoglutarate dehydrogenase E1 component